METVALAIRKGLPTLQDSGSLGAGRLPLFKSEEKESGGLISSVLFQHTAVADLVSKSYVWGRVENSFPFPFLSLLCDITPSTKP